VSLRNITASNWFKAELQRQKYRYPYHQQVAELLLRAAARKLLSLAVAFAAVPVAHVN
jgi:hypothetical protein